MTVLLTEAGSALGVALAHRLGDDVRLTDRPEAPVKADSSIPCSFLPDESTDALVEGDFIILNPLPDYVNGVVGGRPQWLLRPHDLIPVQLSLSNTTPGFYVPNRAVTLVGDQTTIYIVEDGIAVASPVTVHDSFEELRRIEGEDLHDGTRVIVGGVHYVSEGQPVTVTEAF